MSLGMRFVLLAIMFVPALFLPLGQAHAQFMGHNFKGDFGLMSGSQPDPGFYLSGMYVRYDGDSLAIDPEEQGELDINASASIYWWQ